MQIKKNVNLFIGSSPTCTNSSQKIIQQAPPGLHSTNSIVNGSQQAQQQINHRSIFQSDNNSFFSSNSFQKIPTTVTPSGNSSIDWTNPGITQIPDSLPTVYSSEDWQAAFGFQTELPTRSSIHITPKSNSPAPSPRIPFSTDNFIDDETYTNTQFNTALSENSTSIASSLLANTPASKFMAEFQQNSLQQRLSLQVRYLKKVISYVYDIVILGPRKSPLLTSVYCII